MQKTKMMKNLNLIFLLLLSWLFTTPSPVFAQTTGGSKITGKLVTNDNKAVDFATLSLHNQKDSALVKSALTDEKGKYIFDKVKAGKYYISASNLNYEKTNSPTFTVDGLNEKSLENLFLKPATKGLQEVNITAKKPFVERRADKVILNVANSTVNAGSTALEVLQRAPGVSLDKDDQIALSGKQGVLVLLDGKQTYMSNQDLANMLRNMQSSEIETIELITSPSAKYDAAGNAGIINIKTKKNKKAGFNGSFTAGTGYGNTSKYNTGLNLNFRKDKLNIYGNYNFGNNGNLNTLDLNRRVNSTGTITNFNQFTEWNNRRNNNSYKAGLDFAATKKTTFGVLISGYNNSIDNLSASNTRMLDQSFALDSSLAVSANGDESYKSNAVNLNYKTTFDTLGRELSIDLDYSKFNGNQDEFRDNNYFTNSGSTLKDNRFIRNFTPSNIDVKSAKLDFVQPLNKTTRLETGWKSSWVKTDNDLQFTQQQANGTWLSDPRISNRFIYSENINAGYLNLNKEFKTTSIQLGLRAEHTNSNGNSITTSQVNSRNYLEWFPSVAVSQKMGKNHQLSLNLNRRIDRPAYDDLNPFLSFLDEYTYQQGNPNLQPQFSNNANLSYTLKSTYTAGINYSKTKDAMTFVTLQNDATKVTVATRRNLSEQEVLGVSFYVPLNIQKWWSVTNDVQVFNMKFNSFLENEQLNTSQTSMQINSTQEFVLSKKAGAEIGFIYQSPMQYGLFQIKSQTVFNLGFNHSFINKKANLKLSVNDVFKGRRSRISTTFANMDLNFTDSPETRIARISFTYNFGKADIKPSRRRTGGSQDEQSRIKQ